MIVQLWFIKEPEKMYMCDEARDLSVIHQEDGMLVSFTVHTTYKQTPGLSDWNFSTRPFAKAFDGVRKIAIL